MTPDYLHSSAERRSWRIVGTETIVGKSLPEAEINDIA
jgi:hypothetical protein